MNRPLSDSLPDVHEILPVWLEKTGTKLARFARVARVTRPWLHRWLRQPKGDVRVHTARRLLKAMEDLSRNLGTPLEDMDLSRPIATAPEPDAAEATQQPAAPPETDEVQGEGVEVVADEVIPDPEPEADEPDEELEPEPEELEDVEEVPDPEPEPEPEPEPDNPQ